MKILSVVGVRRSGKTTTITSLITELKSRGYRVGTVKTIFCPVFSMDDPKSNTARHKAAGAEVVVARGNGETDFSYPATMDQNAIFEKLDVDILILEGDYESAVPRIVCAHNEAEVSERKNAHTFLVSGRIADQKDSVLGLPAISAMKDICALADAVVDNIKDETLPVAIEESRLAYTGICQCGCEKQNDALEAIAHPSGRKHLFLTGEKQIGKSTLIIDLMERFEKEGYSVGGFQTKPIIADGKKRGYMMHALIEPKDTLNDIPVTLNLREKGAMIGIAEAFNAFGAPTLREAVRLSDVVVIDELGKAEKQAEHFQKTVFDTLDKAPFVIGVLQKTQQDFIEAVSSRSDVEVVTVTAQNRDSLKDTLYEKAIEELNKFRQYKYSEDTEE